MFRAPNPRFRTFPYHSFRPSGECNEENIEGLSGLSGARRAGLAAGCHSRPRRTGPDNAAEADKAATLARAVDGVKSVHTELPVRNAASNTSGARS